MLSPDRVSQPVGLQRPALKLVRAGGGTSLTPMEREFLAPLLEIQETPPSPVQRGVLWTVVGLVVALVIWACVGKLSVVATATGKFIPDGRVKQVLVGWSDNQISKIRDFLFAPYVLEAVDWVRLD